MFARPSMSSSPCLTYVTLTAVCLSGGIKINRDNRQTWISPPSSSLFTSTDLAPEAVSTLKAWDSENIKLTVGNNDNIETRRECEGIILRLIGNNAEMQRSIEALPKRIVTARLLTTANEAWTWRSLILSNIGTIPSMGTACLVAMPRLR